MTFQQLKKLAATRKGVTVTFDREAAVTFVNSEPYSNLVLAAQFVRTFEKTEAEQKYEKECREQCAKTSNYLLFGETD
jgi:hypothetical protein